MFCILIFHALCFYIGSWNYWRTEIVPIWSFFEPIVEIGLATFIFISGFLYGYYNIEKSKYLQFSPFVTKKTKRLLFPYLIWSCIMIIFLPLNMHWREMITGTGHLWFLLVLYELFLICFCLNNFNLFKLSYIYDIIIWLFSFIFLYLWQAISPHRWVMCLESMFFHLPTFFLGIYCAKYKIHYHCHLKNWAIIIEVASISTLLLISHYPINSVPYVTHIVIRVSTDIIAVSSFVLASSIYIPIKYQNLLTNLDHNSMGIYIFNQIVVFIVLLIPVCRQFLAIHYLIGPFVIFLVSFLIPWGLAVLFNKTKYLSWTIGL